MRLFGKTQDRIKAASEAVTSTAGQLRDAHGDGELLDAVKRIIHEQGVNVAELTDKPEAISAAATLIRKALPPPLRLVVRPKRVESVLITIVKQVKQRTSNADADPVTNHRDLDESPEHG